MIKLRRMTQAEYENYYLNAVQNLADETAKANGVSPDETLCSAKRCFETLLPEGNLNVPDQYLYNILADEQKVGVLWFGIRRDRVAAVPEAYVWDIVIEASSRHQGYGKQTMLALEEEVRTLGISRISLNVFAHNTRAQNLYERLGYSTISSLMLKTLEHKSAANN